jgi:NAD+ diphosphatase
MLDRLASRRTDAQWLQAQREDPSSRALLVCSGRVATTSEHVLILVPPEVVPNEVPLTFLGTDACSSMFAAHVDEEDSRYHWIGLREIGVGMPPQQREYVVTSIALDNWMRTHQRCPRCGSPTIADEGGWSRHCPTDGSRHFPRTDPAIIVLTRDSDDRALLGRQSRWPEGWFSTLAGFVESGETAEEAVRREVHEETGIVIGTSIDDVQYVTSQPWPFPNSLMLGFQALARTTNITVDGTEIADARWFGRDELAAACATGEVRLPPSVSIARRLIEQWYGRELPGDWLRA